MSELLIDLHGIRKTFRSPFLRRPKVALRGIDLEVRSGEIFGFLGPNGAGKTTTIKILLGLIRPSAGTGTMLGQPFGSVDARREMGFLPDSPNFYRYLTARELLRFTGKLHGLDRSCLDRRVEETLAQVRLAQDAWDRQLRTFSRGMLQRTGIGAAILHRPRLVVLDEPMNGLDPQGRSEFRDLLHDLKDEGVTVFLSSHVLADIESTADRVAILDQGRLVQTGSLEELLAGDRRTIEIVFDAASDEQLETMAPRFEQLRPGSRGWIGEVADDEAAAVVRTILEAGGRLHRYGPRRISLEDHFLRQVGRSTEAPAEPPETPERAGAAERASRPASDERTLAPIVTAPAEEEAR